MSDFPFRKGDLVDVYTSWWHGKGGTVQAMIVSVGDNGFVEVLIDGNIKIIHRNYIVTPKIKSVRMTGNLK